MADGPYIAQVAALVGNPARANMLIALMGGQALTASELANVAGVSPQTASGHLAKLLDGALLQLTAQGRHRYYRLASAEVARGLESLMTLTGDGSSRHRPRSVRDNALADARICYDHLAGRLGVALADAMGGLGFVLLNDQGAVLTAAGRAHLADLAADIPFKMRGRRALCRPCLDWSERRWHIGGVLGSLLAQRCFELGWVERIPTSRAVRVTQAGKVGLLQIYNIRW